MAKYRHRTFEMYDFYDEAADKHNVRSGDTTPVSELESTEFNHLAVTQADRIVRIAFRNGEVAEDPTTCPYREEFARLASLLRNDSRVIVDFAGVAQFPAISIDTLETFDRRLKSKGSRLILCNLQSEVKAVFYPARLPPR